MLIIMTFDLYIIIIFSFSFFYLLLIVISCFIPKPETWAYSQVTDKRKSY